MNTQKIAYYLLHKGTIGVLLLSCSMLIATIGMAQKKSKQPLVVFVTGDHEYSSEATMPKIAAELEKNYGFRTKVLKAYPDHNAEENIPGLEALKEADMAVFFLRWRRLPAEQVKLIEEFLQTKKPMVGFRTTTHAFNYPKSFVGSNPSAFAYINSAPIFHLSIQMITILTKGNFIRVVFDINYHELSFRISLKRPFFSFGCHHLPSLPHTSPLRSLLKKSIRVSEHFS